MCPFITHVSAQAHSVVSVVGVSIEPLIEALRPEPQRCLDAIHSLLPQLASARHEAFMCEVVAATSRLNKEPSAVPELAEHVVFIGEIGAKRAALDAAYEEVQQRYGICKARSAP